MQIQYKNVDKIIPQLSIYTKESIECLSKRTNMLKIVKDDYSR